MFAQIRSLHRFLLNPNYDNNTTLVQRRLTASVPLKDVSLSFRHDVRH
jgi:hypothetical protein